jgi:hypothetical protein
MWSSKVSKVWSLQRTPKGNQSFAAQHEMLRAFQQRATNKEQPTESSKHLMQADSHKERPPECWLPVCVP